jgi:hypothetical protein
LVQVDKAAQTDACFAWLVEGAVGRCDGAVRGEQLLDGERGLVVSSRYLHHGQPRLCHMHITDLPHTRHDVLDGAAGSPAGVCSSERGAQAEVGQGRVLT